jgi:hypothetical protein
MSTSPITRKGQVGQAGNAGHFAAKTQAEAEDSVDFDVTENCVGSYPYIRDDVRPLRVGSPLSTRLHLGRQAPGPGTGGGIVRASERRDFIGSEMLADRAGDVAAQGDYLERHRDDIHEFVNDRYSANYYFAGTYPDGTPTGVLEFVTGAGKGRSDAEALRILRSDTGIDRYASTPQDDFERDLGHHLDRCEALDSLADRLNADQGLTDGAQTRSHLKDSYGLTDTDVDSIEAAESARVVADGASERADALAGEEAGASARGMLTHEQMAQHYAANKTVFGESGFGYAEDDRVQEIRETARYAGAYARSLRRHARETVFDGKTPEQVRAIAREAPPAPF